MPSYQRHVFVCINERPPGNPKGCCKDKGAEKVRDELKKRLYERGLKGVVRANNAGCLDQCSNGVTVVVYPEQVWYGHVTVEDVPELIERHIIGGQFVERLMLPDQPHLEGRTSAAPLTLPPLKSPPAAEPPRAEPVAKAEAQRAEPAAEAPRAEPVAQAEPPRAEPVATAVAETAAAAPPATNFDR